MTSGDEEFHLEKTMLRPFLKDGVCFSHNSRKEDSMAFLRLAFHGGKIFAEIFFSIFTEKF